jgi:hypothetical protein
LGIFLFPKVTHKLKQQASLCKRIFLTQEKKTTKAFLEDAMRCQKRTPPYDPGALERTEFKARRIIDKRDLCDQIAGKG